MATKLPASPKTQSLPTQIKEDVSVKRASILGDLVDKSNLDTVVKDKIKDLMYGAIRTWEYLGEIIKVTVGKVKRAICTKTYKTEIDQLRRLMVIIIEEIDRMMKKAMKTASA